MRVFNEALAILTPEVPISIPVALLAGTCEEKLARASYLGADGVEPMSTDPAELEAGRVRASLQEHGPKVVAIGSGAVALVAGLTLLHADQAQAGQVETCLRRLIDFAAAGAGSRVSQYGFGGHL